MIVGKTLQKELILLLSDKGQPAKVVLAQTCMGVLLIRSVSDTIFAILLLPKPAADRRGPPVVPRPLFEKHCFSAWGHIQTILCEASLE
jgi:hypothetical protein